MDFYCAEENCPATGVAPYVLRLPDEACMDEQNFATVFCPHCGRSLRKKKGGSAAPNDRNRG